MVKITDIKVRRNPRNRDIWMVTGGGKWKTLYTQNHDKAKMVAGARRRVIIKHALYKVGVKRLPRSLMKGESTGVL